MLNTQNINIKERKPVWIALSVFYLDTELKETDFQYISSVISQSPYSFAEVTDINKFEVFPVLKNNLLSNTGIWEGFDEDWLVKSIVKSLQNRSKMRLFRMNISYCFFYSMIKKNWEILDKIINQKGFKKVL